MNKLKLLTMSDIPAEEVRWLCERGNTDFLAMKQWYDGYSFRDVGSVYNPNSVMQAVDNGTFDSYWTETSAARV